MKLRLIVALAACATLAGCRQAGPVQLVVQAPDPAQRAQAAEQLGAISATGKAKQDLVAALALATADPDKTVREKAVQALAKQGGDEARQALLDVVRGRQYTRAALKQYTLAVDKQPDQPDILDGLAKAQTDVGNYADAEKTWGSLSKVIESQDPQQAQRYYNDLRSGYENLRMAFEKAGDKDGVARMGGVLATVEAKLKAMPQQPGGGMFGGFPGGGLPPGVQIQP